MKQQEVTGNKCKDNFFIVNYFSTKIYNIIIWTDLNALCGMSWT